MNPFQASKLLRWCSISRTISGITIPFWWWLPSSHSDLNTISILCGITAIGGPHIPISERVATRLDRPYKIKMENSLSEPLSSTFVSPTVSTDALHLCIYIRPHLVPMPSSLLRGNLSSGIQIQDSLRIRYESIAFDIICNYEESAYYWKYAPHSIERPNRVSSSQWSTSFECTMKFIHKICNSPIFHPFNGVLANDFKSSRNGWLSPAQRLLKIEFWPIRKGLRFFSNLMRSLSSVYCSLCSLIKNLYN